MRIAIKTPPGLRRWHAELASALRADGHHVTFVPSGVPEASKGHGVALILALERLIYRSRAGVLFDEVSLPPSPEPSTDRDLAIDLTGAPSGAGWSVLFDGIAGEAGLLAALLEQRAPVIAIASAENGAGVLATGLPALENPRILGIGLDAILARCIGLCRRTVTALARGTLDEGCPLVSATPTPGHPITFGVTALAGRITSRLDRLTGRDHRWRTGWRRLGAESRDAVQRTLAWPSAPYRWLPDDGKRIYADPFIVSVEGRTILFVEEYPYATERGIISAVELGPDGPVGTPRPVLECPVHLSYPLVFARDGALWMIPETYGARRIELYRADPFPDRWVLDRVLVEDVGASDATLIDHEGRLYLFASTDQDGGSTWDQLSIFHAETLAGPWLPHEANPVLIDAASARPGGFAFRRDGALVRPAQDCRRGYGAGLTFCRIDRLTPEVFSQTQVAQLSPLPSWRASGVHTLNAADGFEVIDRIGPRGA